MTNLPSSVAPTEWAAFVAIDWADQKHFWALSTTASEKVERGQLDAAPEAVEAWAAELNVRFSGRRSQFVWNRNAAPWFICWPSTRIW
jgi:hypothetical protein